MEVKKRGFLFLVISSAPIAYILGIYWLILHVVGSYGFLKILHRRSHYKLTKIDFRLILFIFFYFVAISFASRDAEFIRVIASLYNLSYWLMIIPVIFLIKNFSDKLTVEVLKALRFNLIVIIISAYFFSSFYEGYDLQYNSLLGTVVGGDIPALISDSVNIKIFYPDYTSLGKSQRLAIFSPYPTALAQLVLALFFLSLLVTKKAFHKFLLWVACFGVIYLTKSRGVAVSFLLCSTVFIYFNFQSKPFRASLGILFSLISLFIAVFYIDNIISFWRDFNSLRANSSNLRFYLYMYSIEYWLEENPIFGVGIKPRFDWLFIPLGSHSTFLGIFFRTGIVGGISFLSIHLTLFVFAYRALKKRSEVGLVLFVSYLSFQIYMVFEDIDAPQYLFLVYSIVIGLLVRLEEKAEGERNGI